MLGVPDKKDENLFELVDGNWQQMKDLDQKINGQVKCRTKRLDNGMGVCGQDYEKGFLWDRIKERALQNDSDDFVVVSLFLSLI